MIVISFPLDCSGPHQPLEFTQENVFTFRHYRPKARQKATLLISLGNSRQLPQAIYRVLSACCAPFQFWHPKRDHG